MTPKEQRDKRIYQGAPETEFDCLQAIYLSIRTIKDIAIFFLAISILGLVLGFFSAIGAFH